MNEAYHQQLDRVEASHWWFQAMRRLVSEVLQVEVPAPARVLDIGSSTGHLIAGLPASYDRRGIEFDADAVAHAARVRPEIPFDVGSIEALPYGSASFDAVTVIDVISAVGVDDDLKAVREVHRVLRPGGTLIAQVAAYEWLRSGHDEQVGTARRYTASQFKKLLQDGGFAPQKVSYRVTALFPLALPWRLMRRNVSQSDVAPVSPLVNAICKGIMTLEHPFARHAVLPFWLSVFAVAKAE